VSAAVARFVDAHRRALLVVVASFALAGIAVTFRLPVSLFPRTDFPRIVILVDNGITPIDVQLVTVTRPIEEAVRLVPGLTSVRSVTGRGSTEISVFFRWDIDILNALHLVQGRMAQIMPTLPPAARFYINRLTFSVFPMIGFSISSDQRSLAELGQLATYDLAPRLYRIEGVAETRIVGGRAPELHVEVDLQRLRAYGLPLTKVVAAIRDSNLIVPAGMVQENQHLSLTTVTGLVHDRAQIEDLVVDVAAGTPILIKNVATVVAGEKPAYNIVTADGRPAVLLNVLQQPDGNAITVADAVNREIESIRRTLPPDIHLGVFYDQSILVRDSIDGVVESILIGLALSIVVLLLFLRSWRSTLVAALVIPIAALVAIVFMKLFDMSFNLMTLGGLAASIGVVIDDAIVMVENILVHLGEGKPPRAACTLAIVELTPALIGSTLTPMVVFVPLVFLGGITAVFFRALAMTLVTALLASLVLAIFFTPVLARFVLRAETAAPDEAPSGRDEARWLRWLTARYELALGYCLHHVRAVMIAAALVLAAAVGLYLQLGSGFLPELDEGAFVLDYIMPPGTSLQETDRVLRHVERFLLETPEVQNFSRRTGARLALAIAEPNTGDLLGGLTRERARSLEAITSELRQKINQAEPVIEVEFPHILEDLIGDLAWSPEPIEIKVFHPDPAVFRRVSAAIAAWLPAVKGAVDVVDRTVVIGPAINLRVDPAKAARAGFTVSDVATLEAATLDGELASTMMRGDRPLGIRVRAGGGARRSIAELQALPLTAPNGTTVPLTSLASIEREDEQTEIRREDLRPLSAVTAQVAGRDLGSVMAEIKARLFKEVPLPAGTEIEFGGLYQIQRESFLGLGQVLLAAVLLIFIILVFEFRSFAHPIAIVTATLLCAVGSFFALWITGSTLNISSFMGAIMVVGIVHKNGILMLDAEQHHSALGLPLDQAIFQAGRRRLRPILMTALATIGGMLPLALDVGSGAQLLQPLAIAVIGGVAVSMLLSLLVTPVVFYALRRRF
jgi:CzcA family heavy metal efflux pump